jgi:UDP-N-acetyl-D-glucosamine dehydrogenase
LEFAEKGVSVLGFDVDRKKVDALRDKRGYIKHIPSERIAAAVESGTFDATTDFSRLPEVDAILICVPTPLDKYRQPDMSFVLGTAETIAARLRKGQLVTLESTTYPGTTDELLQPLFENAPKKQANDPNAAPFKVGEDFYLAFSPEREDPNNPKYTTATIPKVIGGATEKCTEIATKLYDLIIVKTVPVSSTQVAEATKLLENIYRSINIALVNELKVVFDRMGVNVWEVIGAANTKPFGFQAFYPGPGLGGHCIPIDPFYLTWKAKEFDSSTRFIELAGEINTAMPYYVVERCAHALNTRKKALNGSKVLILGMAYKKNVDDMRESPSLKLTELLRETGATVDYNDPYIPVLPATRKYQYDMTSVELTPENLAAYDLILLSSDHDDYDYAFIHKHASLIVDTRNGFGAIEDADGKVFRA